MKYVPGTQLWVQIEGYPFWPAKVVDYTAYGLEPPGDGNDTAVLFYGTHELSWVPSYDDTSIVPLEYSSEKNVTHIDALNEALAEARADVDIVAYEPDDIGEVGETEEERAARKAAKRARKEEKKRLEREREKEREKLKKKDKKEKHRRRERSASDSEDGEHRVKKERKARKQPTLEQSFANVPEMVYREEKKLLPDSEALEYVAKIREALDLGDVRGIRFILSDLTHIKCPLEQLYTTKLGVAVSEILRYDDMMIAHRLAKCILEYWFSLLDFEHQKKLVEGAKADIASVASDEGADGAHVALDKFTLEVSETLSMEDNDPNVCDRIAKAIEDALNASDTDPERRLDVLHQLRKPGHTQLRRQLINGEVTPADFVKMSADALMTDQERAEVATSRAEHPHDVSHLSDGNVTTIYPCPECKAANATFTELRMKYGEGEEHVEVMLTCLECNHTWKRGEAAHD